MKIFAVVLLAFSGYASANDIADISGNCAMAIQIARAGAAASNENYIDATACIGYVRGVSDGYKTLLAWNPTIRPVFCAPANVSNKQLILVVDKWISANPEQMHFQSASQVLNALQLAFPCK